MRVTVIVDVDGHAATVAVDVHPADLGVEPDPATVLARLVADARERASAEARKRKSGPHAWAGFLRSVLHRLGAMNPGDAEPRPRPARPTPAMRPSARPGGLSPDMEMGAFAIDVVHAIASVATEWVPHGIAGAMVPRGRFGDHKVFIASAHRALSVSGSRFGAMTLEEFKSALLACNRDGLLALSRADLVGAMDPAEVAASAIEDANALFHFVQPPHRRR